MEPEFFEAFINILDGVDKRTLGAMNSYYICVDNITLLASYLYFRRLLVMGQEGPADLVSVFFQFSSIVTGQEEQAPR